MMTSSVIERWHHFIDGGHDPAALDGLLAEDCVFYSPAVFTPQAGRAKSAAYLLAAAKMFGGTDFHYVEEWNGERSAVLEFAATIDGIYVNGIDMIAWNDDDRIVSFKVMMRPFKGLQAIMPRMAELLQTA
ncbi:hypothetical protein TUM20985_03550 [Mycobacterium antarcticum]|uniref:nuclear transport factor 2 family protein n=1 Tax=unclassified Mycolicibacterium TaxID=2636767 RepID=UPI002383005F|nr:MULTISPECIES: nuclear transport factor 2 family protein [unclassified Mycolicibacterium]BDX29808.1 hypothetical protein TUM20985_03550 [Mycolicibacterium sp. TUM20985]GLP73234.1 hypothetical protein TUM20983_03440 [Mycolicibacterium sp. TUM20983]